MVVEGEAPEGRKNLSPLRGYLLYRHLSARL